jgi:hypothetical protein
MIDGSPAIHPHHLGLFTLRGTSSTCQFGHAKHCVINTCDTNYLLSAHDVMAIILHLAQNMETEPLGTDLTTLDVAAPPISVLLQLAVDSMMSVVTPVTGAALVVVCLLIAVHAAIRPHTFVMHNL